MVGKGRGWIDQTDIDQLAQNIIEVVIKMMSFPDVSAYGMNAQFMDHRIEKDITAIECAMIISGYSLRCGIGCGYFFLFFFFFSVEFSNVFLCPLNRIFAIQFTGKLIHHSEVFNDLC